ncbi:hypothetical protein BAY60_16590 [Prauserella muralis]|uniref:Uncharacterized protein n=1 Tax=Prauserella muralis TaxID=588067 RepID=A0A2V4B177_9PSEU|nr:hypothetical protein BAY60_16590 [Prauserella muralis]
MSDTAPLRAVRPAPPNRPRGTQWLLRGAGLVAVAVVAGLIWGLLRTSGSGVEGQAEPTVTEDPLTSGAFDYTVVAGPQRSTDCAGNAYGDVADWLASTPCSRLDRALYTTGSGEARALVSVVLVTMPDAGGARQLKAITDTEGTGNINDLVRDGTANLPGAPEVAGGEYASTAEGSEVTIVEAAYFGERAADDTLARIAADALRLSAALR